MMEDQKILYETAMGITEEKKGESEEVSEFLVKVFYDCKHAKEIAEQLCTYIQEYTEYDSICDHMKNFEKNEKNGKLTKIIMIGHHSRIKNTRKSLTELRFDRYEIKYGFKQNACVLTASKSKLKNSKKEKACFLEDFHTRFEKNPNEMDLRKAQFIYGVTEFAENGLQEFLDLKQTTEDDMQLDIQSSKEKKRLAKKKEEEYLNKLCDEVKKEVYKKYITNDVIKKVSEAQKFYETSRTKGLWRKEKKWETLLKIGLWEVQRYEEDNRCRILDLGKKLAGYGKIEEIVCPILAEVRQKMQLEKVEKRDWGIVFCGGGAKGAYQIGVWKWLIEHGFTDKITGISGASVGALNSILFVNGDYKKACTLWYEIESKDIIKEKKRNYFAITESEVIRRYPGEKYERCRMGKNISGRKADLFFINRCE